MKKGFRSRQEIATLSPLEEGVMLFADVIIVVDLLYEEHKANPRPDYLDVHLLSESVARMFPRHLVAQHGFVYLLASREKITRFEDPYMLRKLWREVTVCFRTEDIQPKLGYLKAVPHSWLLHGKSGTIIDLLPLGAEPGVDYPVRHAPHPDRPPYNLDPKSELVQGKLPTPEKVTELWEKLEALAKGQSPELVVMPP